MIMLVTALFFPGGFTFRMVQVCGEGFYMRGLTASHIYDLHMYALAPVNGESRIY